jgi:hypothetical protein
VQLRPDSTYYGRTKVVQLISSIHVNQCFKATTLPTQSFSHPFSLQRNENSNGFVVSENISSVNTGKSLKEESPSVDASVILILSFILFSFQIH